MSTENKVFITPEGEHDYNKKYEKYTFVTHTQGENIKVYMSIKDVPPFISILDTNYWKFVKSNTIDNSIDISGKADKVDTPQIFNASSYSTLTNEQCEAIKNGDIIVAGSGSSTNTYIVRFKTSSQLTFYGISGKYFLEICTYKKNNSVWAVNKHSSDPVLIQAVNTGQPQYGMYPNVVYNLGVISDNFTFLLKADQQDTTIAYIWHWTFSTGDTAPTITWPAEITMWSDGEAPEIEANKYYEISVMNGVGTVISADIPQEETEVEP